MNMLATESGQGSGLLEVTSVGADGAICEGSLISSKVSARCVAGGSAGGEATWVGAVRNDVCASVGSYTCSMRSGRCSDEGATPDGSRMGSPVSSVTSRQAARSSCLWGGACLRYMRELARSHMVSVRLQKIGGEFTHPMVSTSGMATRGGSPEYLGNTTAKDGASSGRRCRR